MHYIILLFSLLDASLCGLMDCSIPGFPVLHCLPELTQTYVHWVSDAIQPSHPLLPPSPLALSLSQHQGLISSESTLGLRWTKYWNFSFSISSSNEYSGLVSFRIDWFDPLESSAAPQFESINSLALYLFCGPTLTSVYECWKNHNFDYMDLCWQSDVSAFYYNVYVCQSFSSKEQRMK